jgi:hypothetical protein
MKDKDKPKSFWKRIKFDSDFAKRIAKDFGYPYLFCLCFWTISCLVFSKPINLLASKLGTLLFDYNTHSLLIYEKLIDATLLGYFLARLLFIKKFFWGQFPALKIGLPLAIWYTINVNSWVESKLVFIPLPNYSNLNFLSLVYFFCLTELLFMSFYYFFKVELRANDQSSFITDVAFDPKKQKQKDELGFDKFANRIASEIKAVSSSESVVFGINGEWGEGKTSMINMIRQQLEDEKYTVVDFHPWKTNSGKAMNQLFFDALKDGLKNKIWGINWKIDRYADALLQLDKTGVGKVIWQFISQPDSVEKQKEKLAESMKLLDKNLVVVVDDLDRLAKNEIADVLKLMRDTANFPNLVFMAAYDRAYLNEAIKKEINEYNYENYMDKIVLWEAPIYRPQPWRYLTILKNQLASYKIIWKEDITDLFHEREGIFSKKTSKGLNLFELHNSLFKNLRSVKRFVNFLIFNYKTVVFEDENGANAKVWFKDFYYLYLLRFFYAKYYDRFQDAYHELYSWTNNGLVETFNDKYWPRVFPENEQTPNNEATKPNDVENIKTIISQLLISDHRNWPATRIVWYKNFFEYFHLGNHEDITMEAFAKMLEAEDFESFKNKIEICDVEKKILAQFNAGEIISALRINSEPSSSENEFFTNYFKQLLWVYKTIKVRCPVDLVFNEIHEYLPGRSNLLKDEDIKIIQQDVLEFIEKERIEEEIQPLIALLIYKYKENKNLTDNLDYKNTFLSVYDAISIAKDNFTKHVKNTTSIPLETIRLYYYCYQKIDENDELVLDDEVIQQMRKLADKYPNDFLKYLIIKYRNEDSRNDAYKLNFILISLFKKIDELKFYINNKTFTEEVNMLVQVINKFINHWENIILTLQGNFEQLVLTDKEKYLLEDCHSIDQVKGNM